MNWLKDKKPLKEGPLYHIENFEETYCFEVKDTEKTDAGTYICVAQNTQGKASTKIPLKVNGKYTSDCSLS